MIAATYSYVYDDIGNRMQAAADVATSLYVANTLNQYVTVTNSGVNVPMTYDFDGNMTRNGAWYQYWDGENNMKVAAPVDATNGSLRVENGYDYMRRRVLKTVTMLTGYEPPSGSPPMPGNLGDWILLRTTRFVWDGWNIAAEIMVDVNTGTTNVTRYVWGLDLSGSIQGAGGVGGLLAVFRNDIPLFPCYDANGNISDYVDSTGAVVAHREFDAFGNTTVATGPLVHELHFWFSTKYLDEETGNIVYQQRQYIPSLGRWASRDPIGEDDANLLYLYIHNQPICSLDRLGLFDLSPFWRRPTNDESSKITERANAVAQKAQFYIDRIDKYVVSIGYSAGILATIHSSPSDSPSNIGVNMSGLDTNLRGEFMLDVWAKNNKLLFGLAEVRNIMSAITKIDKFNGWRVSRCNPACKLINGISNRITGNVGLCSKLFDEDIGDLKNTIAHEASHALPDHPTSDFKYDRVWKHAVGDAYVYGFVLEL